jgi:hypothetical protein
MQIESLAEYAQGLGARGTRDRSVANTPPSFLSHSEVIKTNSHKTVFEELRDNGRFLEDLTYAWGTVESDIDQCVVEQFGMLGSDTHPRTEDPKIRYILKASFDRKIDFLIEVAALSKPVHSLFRDLFGKRNGLFHSGNYSDRALRLGKAEKNGYLNA